MNDELDPNLLAMFDAAKEESLDDSFVDELMIRVDRDRRRGLIVWAAVAAVMGKQAVAASAHANTRDLEFFRRAVFKLGNVILITKKT